MIVDCVFILTVAHWLTHDIKNGREPKQLIHTINHSIKKEQCLTRKATQTRFYLVSIIIGNV